MDEQEQAAKPKRRRRRTQAEDAAQVTVGDDTPSPAPGIFPVRTVRVPWSVRLGLVRREVTAGARDIGPRRMLLRDSSALLMVLALVVLLASQAEPTPAADVGAEDTAFPTGGGLLLPGGTLNLLSPTPEVTLAPGETPHPTVAVSRATLPPWCANSTCTVYVTPSPKPTPKPTAKPPAATPTPVPCDPLVTPDPSATPTTTPCATPIPTATPAPTASSTTTTTTTTSDTTSTSTTATATTETTTSTTTTSTTTETTTTSTTTTDTTTASP